MKIIKYLLVLMISGITVNAVQALNPSRTYKTLPEKYNLQYKASKVKTLDRKAEINVWDFPSTVRYSSASVILLAHNGEGNMADYLSRVDALLTRGHRVVIFDYRGFGESSAFEIDNNMYIYPQFINDLETAIEYVWGKTRQPFNLYGWGMGGGLALGVGYNRPEVKKIITDTPFLSMEDLETRFSSWEQPMEVPFAGYDKRFEPTYALQMEPTKNLEKVLIIVGSNDVLFKVQDIKALMAKRRSIFAPLQVVENPDRKDNFTADKAAYLKAINAFLGK